MADVPTPNTAELSFKIGAVSVTIVCPETALARGDDPATQTNESRAVEFITQAIRVLFGGVPTQAVVTEASGEKKPIAPRR